MKIHFIGIGGIGISALAQYMQFNNHQISGSDICETTMTQELQKLGIDVNIGHNANAINNQDLVIHSAVIRPDNPEIIAAKEKGIKVLSRREALPFILAHKKVYSVAGAHGKSTTTAILAAIMDGSAIIGAKAKSFDSNVRYENNSDTVIFEADESDGSFINSNPYCAIVTNAEPEHMEYYDYNYELFYESYRQFLRSAKYKVVNAEDPFLATLCMDEVVCLHPARDIKNIEYVLIDEEPHTRFELKEFGIFEVWGFGKHIAIDASLAILAASIEMDIEQIRKNILSYKGIGKRFDIINSYHGGVVIDDYGHHPTEITATLKSVKEYARLKGLSQITIIWQPHKYSRTIDNLDAFINCFEGIKRLVILPVYAAGEMSREIDFKEKFKRYNPTIVDTLVKEHNHINLIKDNQVVQTIDSGLIVGFGAGDITYKLRGYA